MVPARFVPVFKFKDEPSGPHLPLSLGPYGTRKKKQITRKIGNTAVFSLTELENSSSTVVMLTDKYNVKYTVSACKTHFILYSGAVLQTVVFI